MKLEVKIINEPGPNDRFFFYGDIIPTLIYHDGLKFKVTDTVYDEDADEYLLEVENTYAHVNTEGIDSVCIYKAKTEGKLQAVKYRKEALNIGLKEAKEWVDAHC